jgi:diacylglycerol kinase (ATP)
MNIPSLPPEVPDQESPYKSVGGVRRIANAMRYSVRGLILAWRVESAFRQELTLALILLPIAFILPLSAFERLALIGSTLLVLIIELLNSSVEAAIDRISLDHHRLSGRAKDFGSAAVFLALLFCAFSWILIAGPLLVYEITRRL